MKTSEEIAESLQQFPDGTFYPDDVEWYSKDEIIDKLDKRFDKTEYRKIINVLFGDKMKTSEEIKRIVYIWDGEDVGTKEYYTLEEAYCENFIEFKGNKLVCTEGVVIEERLE